MKKFRLAIVLILALFINSGCVGTIIVATVLIKKKRARARAALDERINPPSDAVVSCSCCGEDKGVTNEE